MKRKTVVFNHWGNIFWRKFIWTCSAFHHETAGDPYELHLKTIWTWPTWKVKKRRMRCLKTDRHSEKFMVSCRYENAVRATQLILFELSVIRTKFTRKRNSRVVVHRVWLCWNPVLNPDPDIQVLLCVHTCVLTFCCILESTRNVNRELGWSFLRSRTLLLCCECWKASFRIPHLVYRTPILVKERAHQTTRRRFFKPFFLRIKVLNPVCTWSFFHASWPLGWWRNEMRCTGSRSNADPSLSNWPFISGSVKSLRVYQIENNCETRWKDCSMDQVLEIYRVGCHLNHPCVAAAMWRKHCTICVPERGWAQGHVRG